MKPNHSTFTAFFFLFLLPCLAVAQGEDFFRSTGKIYVVVAVLVVIFIGFIIYMFRIDKRLDEVENKLKNGQF